MKDFSYEIEGIKVRATEPESMGSLIEIDLKSLKATTDGTFLVSSKALQAVGDWAFGVDGLAAEKAGKPPPDREKAPKPSETLHLINTLLGQVPGVIAQIKTLKESNPIEKGFSAAMAKFIEEQTREMISEDPSVKEFVRDIIQQSFNQVMGESDEGEEGEEGEEKQ